jgi:hypothetical protein
VVRVGSHGAPVVVRCIHAVHVWYCWRVKKCEIGNLKSVARKREAKEPLSL